MNKRTKIIITSLLFFATCFLLFLWQGIYLPKNLISRENQIFSIEKGQNLFQIAQNLQKEGFIKHRFFFDFYLVLGKNQGRLRAGKYEINSSMSIVKISEKFLRGKTAKIEITVPEGFTLKQIEDILTPYVVMSNLTTLSAEEFREGFDFLKDAPDGASLEGFLFPDTYFFELDVKKEDIARVFLENFDRKLTPELRSEISRQQKNVFEIVTMASLIEKEVRTLDDKKLVSGILWKRLKANMPLQIDATINYIKEQKTTRISIEDTKIDSPYNTYKYRGLPAGPISNPGIDSIIAAIYPENSNYWYYLSTSEGKTIFSKTLEEHNIAKAKYLK